jgi:hypothetical protein
MHHSTSECFTHRILGILSFGLPCGMMVVWSAFHIDTAAMVFRGNKMTYILLQGSLDRFQLEVLVLRTLFMQVPTKM